MLASGSKVSKGYFEVWTNKKVKFIMKSHKKELEDLKNENKALKEKEEKTIRSFEDQQWQKLNT